MSTFEEELQKGLREVAQMADPAGEARVLQAVDGAGRSRRRKVVAFMMGVAMAAGLALGLNGLGVIGGQSQERANPQASPKPAPSSNGEMVGLVEPGEPCSMAKHAATVEELETDVEVWTPENATLTDAWTCGDTPVLLYGDIQITYEDGWDNVDVRKKWAAMQQDRGGHIETILGRPARVTTPAEGAAHEADHPGRWRPGPAPGRVGVMVVVDGTLIATTAKGDVPVEKLIELTNSIKLPPELQRSE